MIQVKAGHLALIVPVLFAAGIGLGMAAGLWQTTASKEPAAYAGGEFAGTANPADIRGSYTLADIAAAFPGVTVGDLAFAFGVTGDASAYQVKSLEDANLAAVDGREIGTDSVRLFVARALGLPYEPEATTGLPARAAEVLIAKGTFTTEQVADLQGRVVGAPAGTSTAAPPTDPASLPAVVAEDRTVKGKTTFKELSDWGVSDADLGSLLGGAVGAPGVSLRDFCAEQDLEFSTIRDRVQALIDAAAP